MAEVVRWAELLPHEFLQRVREKPVVYLPLGLCEPHGPIAAFGLDTLKADWLCDEAARRFGGIVAPTLGYQIHEAGFHAPWLAEVLGNVRPRMTAMPPHVMLYFFLYQLRAFYNAGFGAVVVISGHSGGNQRDFRRAAALFEQTFDLPVYVASDPELVEGRYVGDHAGAYEISQLLAIRPDLVALKRRFELVSDNELGRFAQGLDAVNASAEQGNAILDACLTTIGRVVAQWPDLTADAHPDYLPYEPIEQLWRQLLSQWPAWATTQTATGPHLLEASVWQTYAQPTLLPNPNEQTLF